MAQIIQKSVDTSSLSVGQQQLFCEPSRHSHLSNHGGASSHTPSCHTHWSHLGKSTRIHPRNYSTAMWLEENVYYTACGHHSTSLVSDIENKMTARRQDMKKPPTVDTWKKDFITLLLDVGHVTNTKLCAWALECMVCTLTAIYHV